MALSNHDVAFVLLLGAWVATEAVAVSRVRRSERAPTDRGGFDQGSFLAIVTGVWVALIVSAALSAEGVGGMWPADSLEAGTAICLGGLFVRIWAIRTLGRYFSPVIGIERDHAIVKSGPYRWLRHPSYTGLLLMPIGAVIALGSLAGTVLTTAVVLVALGYRIRVEERMLVRRFGAEYEAYSRATWRLIPWVY